LIIIFIFLFIFYILLFYLCAIDYLWIVCIGGFGVGFLSVIQGGCPLRNYVMAAEGNKTAITYILGLAVGAVIFHLWVVPFVKSLGL